MLILCGLMEEAIGSLLVAMWSLKMKAAQIGTGPREMVPVFSAWPKAYLGTIQDVHSAYTFHVSLKLKLKLEFLSIGKNKEIREIFASTETMCNILSQKIKADSELDNVMPCHFPLGLSVKTNLAPSLFRWLPSTVCGAQINADAGEASQLPPTTQLHFPTAFVVHPRAENLTPS